MAAVVSLSTFALLNRILSAQPQSTISTASVPKLAIFDTLQDALGVTKRLATIHSKPHLSGENSGGCFSGSLGAAASMSVRKKTAYHRFLPSIGAAPREARCGDDPWLLIVDSRGDGRLSPQSQKRTQY